MRVYALKSSIDLRYRWFAHIFFFSFLYKKNMLKENKKVISPDFYLYPAYIYTCVLRTPNGIYVYYHYSTSGFLPGSPGVSSRHLSSHPSTPHAVCVCVCTHTHTTHTHQPHVKNGETLQSPNESLTLQTNANLRPAGKTPLTPLVHMHAIVFKTPVNSAENTC